MTRKLKTIDSFFVPEPSGNQTLVLACNERAVQIACHTALATMGIREYTIRPIFGAVNCLAFNDNRNAAPTLDVIKKYIQNEGVNRVVILCHSNCAADQKKNRPKTVSESVEFQLNKANRARNVILSALNHYFPELEVLVRVLTKRNGKFYLQREIIPKTLKKSMSA